MTHIKYKIDNSVGIITLSRPEVLNSFNNEMTQELQTLLKEIENDFSIRAILLTGEGRAFCAGQDLSEIFPTDTAQQQHNMKRIVEENYNPIITLIRTIEKPFICAVNGVAAGAGANLALTCDIVVASREASFIEAFCKIGLVPDIGGTFFLPRLVGLPRATAMMMLGERITAEQAYEIGMIYKVYDHGMFYDEALALAKYMSHQPTKGLGLTKRALNKTFSNDLQNQLEYEAELQQLAGKTKDYQEGVKAFFEKRTPKFKGE